MNHVDEAENHQIRQASAEARALLAIATKKLRAFLEDEPMMAETPIEVGAAMEGAAKAVDAAMERLEGVTRATNRTAAPLKAGPTRQQGQFLAFIHEFMMRNEAGVAPSHAELQRYFNLTAPSVNSMLARLEQRGFITRISGKARAIELTIASDQLPRLDRPFKF